MPLGLFKVWNVSSRGSAFVDVIFRLAAVFFLLQAGYLGTVDLGPALREFGASVMRGRGWTRELRVQFCIAEPADLARKWPGESCPQTEQPVSFSMFRKCLETSVGLLFHSSVDFWLFCEVVFKLV